MEGEETGKKEMRRLSVSVAVEFARLVSAFFFHYGPGGEGDRRVGQGKGQRQAKINRLETSLN